MSLHGPKTQNYFTTFISTRFDFGNFQHIYDCCRRSVVTQVQMVANDDDTSSKTIVHKGEVAQRHFLIIFRVQDM